jgi:hypothetical protein
MYIVQPQWLAQRGIISKGDEVQIESNLNQPGFRFSRAPSRMTWFVAPDRIAVETTDQGDDCGDFIAKILAALPETPLFAVGNNTTYTASVDSPDSLPQEFLAYPVNSMPGGESYRFSQRSVHLSLERDAIPSKRNLVLTYKADGTTDVLSNVQTEVRDRPDASRVAVDAARRFFQDRAELEPHIRHFLRLSIANVSNTND